MQNSSENVYFDGSAIYGDDFNEEQIRHWYEEEEHGYYDLTRTYSSMKYGYHELNRFHAFRFLRGHYGVCLAMGCSTGDDIAPLAPHADRFIAIEPVEKWWKPTIGGKPAQYMKPAVNGDIPVASSTVDLVTSLAVLHHVPNASHVVHEMCRVLRPGGRLVMREPVCTMGDWRRPRRGLTKNERGFPPGWIERSTVSDGMTLERRAYCGFPLTSRVAKLLGIQAYNSRALVRLDALWSSLTQFNLHYHRDAIYKKIAPIHAFYILRKS